MVSARLAKLKATLVNLIFVLPEKNMAWNKSDEEREEEVRHVCVCVCVVCVCV